MLVAPQPEPKPHASPLLRLAGGAALAGGLTEVVIAVALWGVFRGAMGISLPVAVGVALAVGGVLTGGAFGLCEGLSRQRPRAALAAAAASIPAVALGMSFAFDAASAGPLKAFVAQADPATWAPLSAWLLLLSGAGCIYGPLAWARRRGLRVLGQTYAMGVGGVVWIALVALLPLRFGSLNLTVYLLPVAARILCFPAALCLGERVVGRALRWISGAEGPAPKTAGRGGRAPGQRHRAKWLSEQAARHEAEGKWAEAASQHTRAFELWPSAERALATARAHAKNDDPYAAITFLERMLAQPRHDRAALDEPAFAYMTDLEAFVALGAAAPLPVDSARSQASGSLDPRWTGHALVGCLVAVLIALMLAPANSPDVSADLHRARLGAWIAIDGEAAFEMARRLQTGSRARGARVPASVWIPGVLVRAGVPAPSDQDDEEANWWLRKAAEVGHLKATQELAWALDRAGNPAAAYPWFRRAAEAGDAASMAQVAASLRFGQGVTRDLKASENWYQRAVEAGDTGAMITLAVWLSHGRQIKSDLPRARALLQRAAEAGSTLAAEELERLERDQP